MPSRTENLLVTDDAIIYTYTDEAPALATASFLPIIKAFTGPVSYTHLTLPTSDLV